MSKLGRFAAALVAVGCAFGTLAGNLPGAYQEVEYIESTGTQRIDTQVVPGADTAVRCDFMTLAYKNDTTIFGCTSWNSQRYLFIEQSNKLTFYDNNNQFATFADNTHYVFETKVGGKGLLTTEGVPGTEKNVSLSNSDGTTLCLFGLHGSAPHFGTYRLYGVTITKGGELKRDLVPCRRASDSVVGLYDLVVGEFLTTECGDAFVAGPLVVTADMLMVTGSPEDIGDVIPAYGISFGHAVGSQEAFSAPAVWTNAEETVAAACVGYKVYTNDAVYVEGAANSFSYVHPDCESGAQLVWQWAVENKVTAAAKVGGTVSKSEEWVALGGNFTATATADAANEFCFYRWADAGGATVSREVALTLKVTEPTVLTAEFAGTLHVDAESGNDDTGDGSAANPFATLQKALAVAADGSTILLQDGTYLMDDPYTTIARPVTIKSVNGPANCALTKGETYADQYKRGIIELNHDDAVVDGLTLRNGYFYSRSPGSPVVITKGVVKNCVVRDNQGGSDGSGNHGAVTVAGGTLKDSLVYGNKAIYNNNGTGVGGGVYLTSGLVENCVISNNATGSQAGGAYVSGGTLRQCLVAQNHGHGGATSGTGTGGGLVVAGSGIVDRCVVRENRAGTGAGVYLSGGKILNSLVIKNHGTNAGGGIRNEGGTVVNCTVADNDVTATTTGTGFYQSKGTTKNTIVYGNPCGVEGDATVAGGTFDHNFTTVAVATEGEGNVYGNAFYKDAANEDYTLLAGSKAIDGGVVYEGVTTDLAGATRPQGAAPDMGCCEYLSGQGALSCSFNAPDVTYFLEEGAATFVATADGADLEGLAYAWYFNGVLQEGETGRTIDWAEIPRGAHTVKLVVSNGAGETAECELKDVIKVTTTHVYANVNGSDTYPYDTAEKGAHKLQDAMDAVWCSTAQPGLVTVQPGSYSPYSKWFVLNKPIHLVAAEGPSVTTIAAGDPNGPSYDGKRVCRGLSVAHEQAWVEGFTVRDGWWYSSAGDSGPGGMRMSAGVVTNCVFTKNRGGDAGGAIQMSGGLLIDCEIFDNYSRYNNDGCNTRGGGIYMTGGEVACCVISNNWAAIQDEVNGTGSGVWMSGGTIRDSLLADNCSKATGVRGVGLAISGGTAERCVISGNSMRPTVVNDGAGVWISGGTVRNCLITGNKANNNGAGVYQTGGTMEFCTVTANTSANKKNSGLCLDGAKAVNRFNIIYGNGDGVASEPECNLHFAKAADFSRNIVQPATSGTDNIGADPNFMNAATGDYTLGAGSPAIDAANDLEEGYLTRDLAGNMRPKDGNGDRDAICDLGCYEAPDASEGPLSCSFSPLESSGLNEVTVTFEASAIGGGADGELHYVWDFGEGELVSESADVPNPTVKFSTCGSHAVSLTVTAEGGKMATKTVADCVKVGSANVFVVQENENARWPFGSWETAATNLNEAFNTMILAEGTVPTITLSNGTYKVGQKAFILSFPIHVTSLEGPETTIVQAYNPEDNDFSRGIFRVQNAGAQVDGLTLTGAYVDPWNTGDGGASALRLSAGVVSNCVIRNSSAGRSSYGAVSVSGTGLLTHSVIYGCSCDSFSSSGAAQHGGGLAIGDDGVVAHTVVSNCYSTSISYDCAGGGVYQYGGTLRDSQVLDCYISGKNYQGAAIWQSGGLCERCVFGDTKHPDGYGAAVYVTGGTNRNNLVRGAWTSKGEAQALKLTGGWFWNNTVVTNGWGGDWPSPVAASVTGGEVKNCLFACNNGTDVSDASGKVSFSRFAEADGARGNTAAEPTFKNAAKGDWRLAGGSAGIDAGDKSVWEGETDPVDILGQPRIRNRKVDMGCCECQVAGFSLIVR